MIESYLYIFYLFIILKLLFNNPSKHGQVYEFSASFSLLELIGQLVQSLFKLAEQSWQVISQTVHYTTPLS